MKPIKQFEEFVSSGIVKKQAPDISRANFLVNESQKSYLFLSNVKKSLGISDENANAIIKMCYDIVMELVRAKMLLDGYNASGFGAHEAEVSYVRKLGFSENEVQFLDQLRYFRNGVLYYGKVLDKKYAETALTFLEKIYVELIDLLK